MGAIQSSINQMLGTVGAGVLGVKHLQGQKEEKEIAAAQLRDREEEAAIKASLDKANTAEEIRDLAGQKIKEQDKIEDLEDKISTGSEANQRLKAAVYGDEILKSRVAMNTLQQKIKAKGEMVLRLNRVIDRVKIGGKK